ncbi:response regulator transcription factor [Gluconacetobacter sacchari]|uniref:Response regulator transcription factor n=2 Tax=Gluconacetobacter sacchari TaxID=92759 RepID=A0A7W4IAD5_9PROT|nr:response regulator transcription factor [Gluconacetobacter sacchari]MBB2159198.1 response regulator transcription factor [Gluconacetobacter sacchari]GBQ22156.1 two component transcriptional regulator [Gluconacetobacter sacchari DSM 12717]
MISDYPKPTLLLVEDDEITRDLYSAILIGAGFTVKTAGTLSELRQQAYQARFDIILLDLRLPDGNALELISELRNVSSAGIIVITSSAEATDRLKALESAVDQYLEKPLHPRELVACVRNLSFRIQGTKIADKGTTAYHFEGWSVDLSARKIFNSTGKSVSLTKNEFRILDALISNATKPLHRDRILFLMSDDEDITTRAVDKAIYRLRLKLQAVHNTTPSPIATVHGFGYRLTAKRL